MYENSVTGPQSSVCCIVGFGVHSNISEGKREMYRSRHFLSGFISKSCVRNRSQFPFQRVNPSLSSIRFSSDTTSSDPNKESNNDTSSKSSNSSLPDKQNEQNGISKKQFKPLRSAPAQFSPDSGIEMLLKKDKKPYIPKLEYKRESFEYPGLPNEDEFTKYSNKIQKRREVTRWSRHIPKIISAVVVVWGMYVIKVWYFDADEDAEQNDLLSPLEFHPFIITHKQKIDDEHYLVEVKPKNTKWQYSHFTHYERKSLWDGDRIWSVEVKQPQIMVVRAYTPLPLYFLKSARTRSGEEEPLLKVIENGDKNADHNGTMVFYIKRYNDGEVSRYILDKKVGEEIELRGPTIDYTFPYHPLKALHKRPTFRDLPSKLEPETLLDGIKRREDVPEFDTLDFYAAGTGIAPILQVLFSRNPYRGFVNVHYSAKSESELGTLRRFLFFLEKVDRIRLIEHYDSKIKTRLSSKDIPKPEPFHYVSQQRLESLNEQKKESPIHEQSEELPRDRLKKRLAILEGDASKHQKTPVNKTDEPLAKFKETHLHYDNALAQAEVTMLQKKPNASLALVCGPDGYIEYVAGGKALVTNEQGPVAGLLGSKGWDNTNLFKL